MTYPNKMAIHRTIKETNKVAVIGAGNVGKSLAQLMSDNGIDVQLISRDREQQKKACGVSDIVLLTVSDNAIGKLCEQLSVHFKPGATVAHCSGALSSDALISAQRRGCFTASLHPLNTFPCLEASLSLFSNTAHSTYLYAEGHASALTTALPLFQHLGFQTVELPSEAKTAYHTACVFACNYLTVLMDLSLESASSAGLDRQQFWNAIQPLIQTTLSNIGDRDTKAALSGPIVRGDSITVQQHITQLQKSTDKISNETTMVDSYLALGRHALTMAEQLGELSNEKLQKLEALLK